MKCNCSGIVTGLLLGLGIAGAAFSIGQGEKQPEPKGDDRAAVASDPKAMQAWMDSMKLGKHHDGMKKYVGEWVTSTKIMMPGAPEMPPTAGSAKFEMMMDGRYLLQTYKGNMMGQPMEGMGIMGYDNNRKLFVNSWVDNFMTGIMPMKGNLSEDGKTLTMIGEMDEPMTGEMGKAVRSRTIWIDDNTFKFTMDEILYGEPFTVVEVTYTRKK